MIFNKTFIHTAKTNDLIEIKSKIGKDVFDSIQEEYANEILKVANEFKLPILIFVFSHPSPSYFQFKKEWNNQEENNNLMKPLNLLYFIGRKNANQINLLIKHNF